MSLILMQAVYGSHTLFSVGSNQSFNKGRKLTCFDELDGDRYQKPVEALYALHLGILATFSAQGQARLSIGLCFVQFLRPGLLAMIRAQHHVHGGNHEQGEQGADG